MAAAQNDGQTATNRLPAKALTKHATDFIATCARYATLDVATACTATLMAAEFIRRVVSHA